MRVAIEVYQLAEPVSARPALFAAAFDKHQLVAVKKALVDLERDARFKLLDGVQPLLLDGVRHVVGEGTVGDVPGRGE